jgi:hypothetical protein
MAFLRDAYRFFSALVSKFYFLETISEIDWKAMANKQMKLEIEQ